MKAEGETQSSRGIVAWMVKSPVASNLFMFVIFLGGIIGATRTIQEVFPDFELEIVTIQVPYPGASPLEVEQGIVLAVEEKLRGLDGVKRIKSTAAEGLGSVQAELLLGEDPNAMLNDIKAAVDRITTFPEDAEKPNVSLLSGRRQVITLVISGEVERTTLLKLAEKARAGILRSEDVTQADIGGLPELEVSIEISRENLESFGLSLGDVARIIRASSIELPSGGIDTTSGELLVRLNDRRRSGDEFGNIIVKSTPQGSPIYLRDIAKITDGFAESDQETYFNGKPAVTITTYRSGDETPQKVADAVIAYQKVLSEQLPDSVSASIWNDQSQLLRGRIDLLMRNAMVGLLLVLLVLALFLDLSLAGWVGLGIPISFMGAFLLMPAFGITINMVTLFAFIVTLGMVVDDAIVVGENIHDYRQQGMTPTRAAIEGAKRMVKPVTFSILTTVAAFGPLFFVPGFIGKIFAFIPAIVVSVLLFSLLESFLILPAHLAHRSKLLPTLLTATGLAGATAYYFGLSVGIAIFFLTVAASLFFALLKRNKGIDPQARLMRPIDALHHKASDALEGFAKGAFRDILRATLNFRYPALASAFGILVVSCGSVGTGILPFNFFPKLEGNQLGGTAKMPYGAPIEQTTEVLKTLENSLNQSLKAQGYEDLVVGVFSQLGQSTPSRRGAGEKGSHLASIQVELIPSEERDITANQVAEAWRKAIPPIAGIDSLIVNSDFGPGGGAAVNMQLSHISTDTLAAASSEVSHTLRQYSELKDVENGYAAGKEQLDFQLLPEARALGITGSDVGRQLRDAFFGAEAVREQRGRNEIRVKVKLPKSQRSSEYDLMALPIRLPSGGQVPLGYVAQFKRGQSPTAIRREEGARIVNISAELAGGVKSPQPVLADLKESKIPALLKKYEGLSIEFVGSQREQGETFSSLGPNFIIALFMIYALLAIPFGSYTQPLVIMFAIPFGFVGAVLGHLLMGYSLSVISFMGLIALSGVVVNDSLVLIDATNEARQRGMGVIEAIVWGASRRLRPIVLTSLTTFMGLAPMILETSVQARFLIPMAISLGFGVLFVTFIVLLLIPCLYVVLERDIKGNKETEGKKLPAEITHAVA